MANYYTLFSIMVEAEPEQLDWLERQLRKSDLEWQFDAGWIELGVPEDASPELVNAAEEALLDSEEGKSIGSGICNVERESPAELWLYSDENAQLEVIADALCAFQEKFGLAEPVTLEWANTASRPILDSFGGGAVVCYKGEAYWMNTGSWVGQKIAELVGTHANGTLALDN